jgi:hypothetical protein
MGRFLTGLSWSQPVAFKAHALGMGLDDVQALVESRDAVVEHLRLHHYAYSLDGVRVVVDSRSRRILSIESEHTPAGSSIFDELGGWSLTDTARNNIHDLGVSISEVMAAIETGEWLPTEQMRTLCRTTNLDVIISESTSTIIAVLSAGQGKALSSVVPRAVGAGAAVGSIPQDVHDLIRRAERARLIVTQASTNHYKIWQDQEGLGSPVVIPSTGSDSYRGLRNSITEIRNRFGIDLREY